MTGPATGLAPNEVQVGTANGPGIWIAPTGTAGPGDLTSAWASPWLSLGYASDDGVTLSTSTDTEDITPWQSVSPIRSVITGRTLTMQFVLWQLNADTLSLYFDADRPESTDDTVDFEVRTDQGGHLYSIGVDSKDGDNVLRIVFPRASLSDAGDMAITKGAAVPLDCTLSALDDNGVLAHILRGPGTAVETSGGGGF